MTYFDKLRYITKESIKQKRGKQRETALLESPQLCKHFNIPAVILCYLPKVVP